MFDNRLFVATRSDSSGITVRQYVPGATGGWLLMASDDLPSDGTGATQTPELLLRHQQVHQRKLGVLYLGQDGWFRSVGWNGMSWTYEGRQVDFDTGLPLGGSVAPAAKDWPDSTVVGWDPDEYRTVAVLPGNSGQMRLYVLEPGSNTWINTNAFFAFTTSDKPAIEYRTARGLAGTPDELFTGSFVIAGMRSCEGGRCPYIQTTQRVSQGNGPESLGTTALVLSKERDWLQNMWAIAQQGASASLFSNSQIDNVFGLFASAIPGEPGLIFYPHADGAPDSIYTVYSDFRILEDYTCLSIGGQRQPVYTCGAPTSGPNVLD